MRTAYISHPECLEHETGTGHPEHPRRLSAIQDRLVASHLFDFLRHLDAPEATEQQLLRVHSAEYLAHLRASVPEEGLFSLDPDTRIGQHSLQAARRAAGAVVQAVDLVMDGDLDRAFCAVRPPGHHAERDQALGFCLYNNIAIGVAHALAEYGLSRIAVLDFDVHQGNGTEQAFMYDDRVMFCSTFLHPFYPFTPLLEDTERMISVPLLATAKSEEFRAGVTEHWLPALQRFQPEFVFISAGFDAHVDDDLSLIHISEPTRQLMSSRMPSSA